MDTQTFFQHYSMAPEKALWVSWRLELVRSGKPMALPGVEGADGISQALWNEKLSKRE